jgi:hypothetical protein
MTWRVATRPGKAGMIAQEVIDPEDWNSLTTEKQQTFQSVSEFSSEQEADKFVKAQVDAAKAATPKLPPKKKVVIG